MKLAEISLSLGESRLSDAVEQAKDLRSLASELPASEGKLHRLALTIQVWWSGRMMVGFGMIVLPLLKHSFLALLITKIFKHFVVLIERTPWFPFSLPSAT